MAKKTFDIDIDLLDNRIYGLVLQNFNAGNLPAATREGRFGYHEVRKLPVFYNGLTFDFVATESYVNQLLGGLSWKQDADVASTAHVDLGSIVAGSALDGVTLENAFRVLLVNQNNPVENGVWVVGIPLKRASDLDASNEFTNAVVSVKYGDNYGGSTFRCVSVNPDIDIDPIEFVDFTPSVPNSTEVVRGKIRIATQAEVTQGLDNETAVTPKSLNVELSSIRSRLDALLPAPPPDLSGKTLSMSTYSAKEQGSGDVHACTHLTSPEGQVANFYNGDAGVLEAFVDGVVEGTRTLSTGSDVGIYGALRITDDSDPIPPGQMGHGIYKQLTALVKAAVLSLGPHSYQLRHSLTGNSQVLSFYVDNPGVTTVSNIVHSLPSITRWISGVPSLSLNDDITISFVANNAVGKHYHSTRVARIQGSQVQALDIAPPSTPPSEGDVLPFTDRIVKISAGSYSENVQIAILAYNSKGDAGTQGSISTGSRVDLISNESTRKTAGSGLFPISGYNGAFDSTKSLKSFYTEELQLLNGKYQRPSGNYLANVPSAGPDYSTGMGSGDRFVLFDTGMDLDNVSAFTLTLNGTEGTWSGVETDGITIQVKVEGATGWLDANKTFSLVGAPVNNGDACMVFALSGSTYKRVSFGNQPRSGRLLVRIGLPNGSNKKFSQNIQIS